MQSPARAGGPDSARGYSQNHGDSDRDDRDERNDRDDRKDRDDRDDYDGHPGPVVCTIDHTQEIESHQILGGHVIRFAYKDLQPFLSANRLVDAQLWLLLDGKKDDLQQLTLALNGIAAQHANGHDHFELGKEMHAGIVARAGLGNFRMQGSESALGFVQRLFLQRGALTIWTRGPFKVKRAKLLFGGTSSDDCTPGTGGQTAPTVSFVSIAPSAALTNQSTITFAFQANQNGVTFKCSLDGAAATVCSTPWSLSGLASGAHQFTVTATNAAGLTSAPVSHAWQIDNTPPDITIDSVQPAAAYTSSSSLIASFSSSKANTLFQCSLDGGAFAACVSPTTFAGLAEGAHTLDVKGTDSLGNVSANPAHYGWTIDQTPPRVSFVQTVNASGVTAQTSPSFTFTANESTTFTCSLDSQPFAACLSPVSFANLAEGQHQFSVLAQDPAGNVSAPATASWQIDLTPPVITLGNIVPAAGLTNSTKAAVEYSVNEVGSSVACTFDGAPLASCVSPINLAFAAEGPHELAIVATDPAGNMSAPTLVDWNVDLTAPIVNFSQILPSAASYIASTSLSATLVGSEPITFTAQLDGIPLPQTVGSTIQLTNLANGSHSLQVLAQDAAGNPAQPLVHNFTVDTVAPSVAISSTQYGSPTTQTSNTFTFSSSKTVLYQCSVDLAGFVPCSTPFSLSGLAEGTHTLSVYGVSLAGLPSPTVTYSWTIDLTPPKTSITTVTPAGTNIAASSVSLQFAVSESATSYCSVDGAAAALCTSPFSAGSLANGSHTIQIYSIDVAGNKETSPASYSFTVDLTTPTLSLLPSVGALTNATAVQFTFSASEPAVFTCTLDGAAATGCLSPLSYSGLAPGSHTFTLNGKNLAGTPAAPLTFSWTIQTTPPVVTVQGTPSASDPATMVFSLASSEANTVFQCAMDGAAATSCASPYTVSNLADGSHVLTVTGTDPAGNVSAPASFPFTVQVAITTSITSVTPSTSPTNNNSITFTFTSNVSGSSFVCSLDGSAFAACASPASYANLADGSHQFTVKAVSPGGSVDPTGATYGWTVSTVPPQILSIQTSVTKSSITINWTTSTPATGVVNWGQGGATSKQASDGGGYGTSHSVTLTGLSASTVYSYFLSGQDRAGNVYSSSTRSLRTSAQ